MIDLSALNGLIFILLIVNMVLFLVYHYRFKVAMKQWMSQENEDEVELDEVWSKKNDRILSSLILINTILSVIFILIL